ncbi:hypothetical protein JBE04_02415 [Streptomyces sp. PRKS01-29]|nr:hypothetical protein [Streptomyces sabulosicollis]MBI0293372.1 hypothetical protein [Streptomyces sabulosicollis]
MRRLRIAAGYHWRNGGTRSAVSLRSAVNGVGGAWPSARVSRSATGRLTIASVGDRGELTRILPFLEQQRTPLAGETVSRSTGRASYRALLDGKVAPDASLLLAECSERRASALPRQGAITMPLRLDLVVRLSRHVSPLEQVSRTDRKLFIRQRRRRGLKLVLGNRVADFDQFYDRMHVPTMRARHGDAARSEPREAAFQCLFEHGVLFFVEEAGTRVGGMLCRLEPEAGRLIVRLVGVLDGGEAHYSSAVYMAMYILVLEWAREQGLSEVDLSISEPFLSKGVLQFKRKLHPHFELPRNHLRNRRLWLKVRRDCAEVRDFLVANPLISIDAGGSLEAVYFYDHQRPPRQNLSWASPGISGATLIDLDDFLSPRPERRDAEGTLSECPIPRGR